MHNTQQFECGHKPFLKIEVLGTRHKGTDMRKGIQDVRRMAKRSQYMESFYDAIKQKGT